MFLLVAEVMIKQNGCTEHPIVPGSTPAVLHYADDTLILFKGATSAARCLKDTLDQFSLATGLHINYSKTVMVPMHLVFAVAGFSFPFKACSVNSQSI